MVFLWPSMMCFLPPKSQVMNLNLFLDMIKPILFCFESLKFIQCLFSSFPACRRMIFLKVIWCQNVGLLCILQLLFCNHFVFLCWNHALTVFYICVFFVIRCWALFTTCHQRMLQFLRECMKCHQLSRMLVGFTLSAGYKFLCPHFMSLLYHIWPIPAALARLIHPPLQRISMKNAKFPSEGSLFAHILRVANSSSCVLQLDSIHCLHVIDRDTWLFGSLPSP